MFCLKCQKSTNNPKFCSKSCSASHNNIKFPKKKLKNRCFTCKQSIISGLKYCEKCSPLKNPKDFTLKEAIYNKHHKSSAFALVRTRARSIIKKLGINKCQNCGYDKHIEVAHIKPINKFKLTTLLSKINSLDNLAALCPNCHWEFENNLIEAAPVGNDPTLQV